MPARLTKGWDAILTVMLVLCALVTTGLVIHREFFGSPARPELPAEQEPVFVKNWKSELGNGIRLGVSTAPVQLIEFADFECPFCASFHKDLKVLRERYPDKVALYFIHLPLPGHRFAESAARAAECAGEQGRFEAMHDRLFQEQDKFGVKQWNEFASNVGVPDLAAFEMCIKSTTPMPRVETGKQVSSKLEIRGTPTLIINGWKLGRPPTMEELERMVQAILSGKSPVTET